MKYKIKNTEVLLRTQNGRTIKYKPTPVSVVPDTANKYARHVYCGVDRVGVAYSDKALDAIITAHIDPTYGTMSPYYWTKYDFSTLVCSKDSREHINRASKRSVVRLVSMKKLNPKLDEQDKDTWAVQINNSSVTALTYVPLELAKRVAEIYWRRYGDGHDE